MKKTPLKKTDNPVEENRSGLKKRDLFPLRQAIIGVGNLPGKKFSYAMLKNLNRINAEIKEITDNKDKKSEKVKFYLELVDTIKKDHAQKTLDGEVKIQKDEMGNDILRIKDIKKYNEDLEKLKLAHPEEVAELEADEKELEEILDKPTEFQIHAVQFEELPEAITPAQMNGIEKLIEGMND